MTLPCHRSYGLWMKQAIRKPRLHGWQIKSAVCSCLSINTPEQFEILAGRGVHVVMDKAEYLAGNVAFMQESGIVFPSDFIRDVVEKYAAQGKTPLLFSRDAHRYGHPAGGRGVLPGLQDFAQSNDRFGSNEPEFPLRCYKCIEASVF